MGTNKEKVEFKAEVAQILNLVIHSLYSHKEVFLRELISNASDAIDKRHHLTLVDENYKKPEEPYSIRLTVDKDNKTLTIEDNGIGLNAEDAEANLGTIASSGTKAFLEQLKKTKEEDQLQLIGQFGVGFYSAFMVAKNVTVSSLKAGSGEKPVIWESDGEGGYSLEEGNKAEVGTRITLQMKDDALEYLEDFQIRQVVKKYSDYVSYPICMKDSEGKEETLNQVSAIWRRSKSEIKEEEYNEFYKYISHDFEDPLLYSHNVIEGALEYRMLIYIPKKAPVNFFREDIRGLRLHVKKMFVTDECKELLPVYLRFVKGVVDSEDLPLNVSRETLQQGSVIAKIKKQLTKKVFDMLEDYSKKDPAGYNDFFKELGVAFKEGLTMDFENKDRLMNLLRFETSQSKSEKDLVSFADYVKRMKKDQKEIFYISGTSRDAVVKSPHLEYFKSEGIEVLYLTDVIDEWAIPAMSEYDGKALKSITQGNLDDKNLSESEKKAKEEADTEFKGLKETIRANLQSIIKDVRLSSRLKESPCCLITDDGEMDVKMANIMKAMNQPVPEVKRVLEINPEHTVIKNMKAALESNVAKEKLESWSKLLYSQALIAEGTPVDNPADFVKNLNALLSEVTQGSK